MVSARLPLALGPCFSRILLPRMQQVWEDEILTKETKRDVFDALMDDMSHGSERWRARYDAALPDDLPVIPELIGKYLKMWKHDHGDLFEAFDEGTSASLDGTKWESVQDWFIDAKDSFDTFARAWVLGVWKVEETGEIVKLEDKD